jgi:hypothetical protein
MEEINTELSKIVKEQEEMRKILTALYDKVNVMAEMYDNLEEKTRRRYNKYDNTPI